MVTPSPSIPNRNSAIESQNGLLFRSVPIARSIETAMIAVMIGTGAAK